MSVVELKERAGGVVKGTSGGLENRFRSISFNTALSDSLIQMTRMGMEAYGWGRCQDAEGQPQRVEQMLSESYHVHNLA